jgi:hypothetical protein
MCIATVELMKLPRCECTPHPEPALADILQKSTGRLGRVPIVKDAPPRLRRKPVPGVKKWRTSRSAYEERIAVMRRGAKDRDLEFAITANDLERIFRQQGGRCAVSGIPITVGYYKQRQTASVDRIDSRIGYVPGNVQWVHKVVKVMKADHDHAYFVAMCTAIANHNQQFTTAAA